MWCIVIKERDDGFGYHAPSVITVYGPYKTQGGALVDADKLPVECTVIKMEDEVN